MRQSAWSRGVDQYAKELKRGFRESYGRQKMTEEKLLNGARDWKEYSYGGCSLIYDEDIAKRLSNPTELKMTRNGQRRPNRNEEWLDTQARALHQASRKLLEQEKKSRLI